MPRMFYDLSKRLLMYSAILLLLGIGFWGADYMPVQIIMVLFTAMIAMTAMIEYVALVKHTGPDPSRFVLGAMAAIFCIAFGFYPSWIWLILLFLAFFMYSFQPIDGAISRIATGSFGMLYILVPIGMILSILYPQGVGSIGDLLLVVYLIAVTKMADTGGYFMGRMFGKKKIAPTISPSKTIVGAVFGLVCSMGMSCLFMSALSMSLTEALCLGAVLGFFAEIGDLAESVLKRDAQVKDSNRIPGFGGVLDLIDSLLFTTPVLFAYFRI